MTRVKQILLLLLVGLSLLDCFDVYLVPLTQVGAPVASTVIQAPHHHHHHEVAPAVARETATDQAPAGFTVIDASALPSSVTAESIWQPPRQA